MRELDRMSVRELHRLRDAVDEALEARATKQSRAEEGAAEAVEDGGERRVGGTLRREKVNCGKEACKRCADGPSHGPYWYLYYYRNGRLASRYLGKTLPDEFHRGSELLSEAAPKEGEHKSRDREGPKPPPADARLTSSRRQDELPLYWDE